MDIGSLLLAFALFFIVAAFVVRPILDRAGQREHAPNPADALLAEREHVLTALRDLDFDHATGKIADDDYQPQRAALVSHGVEILQQLDAIGVNGRGARNLEVEIEAAIAARRKGGHQGRPTTADAEIEMAVAAARGKTAAMTCHNCGTAARPGDQFCSKCGTPLALTCSNCGQPHIAGDKFCGKCGTPLAAPAEA